MSAATQRSGAETGEQTGCYVYGILPGDVELTDEIRGVGHREVRLLRTDALAALVSEVDLLGPIGTPQDLQAHQKLLDAVAVAAPVLPMRFGAFLLEGDQEDELDQAVQDLSAQWEGRVEFRVQGPMAPYDFVGVNA